jgi:sugar lactone lactonase YvrE
MWDEENGALWWIDWTRGVLYESDLVRGSSRAFQAGPDLAAVAPWRTGHLILALGHGFAELNCEDGSVREIARVESENVETRMCDGKCDAHGRFWAGTMALDERSHVGALFVMETDGKVRCAIEDVVVSNGLCWSPDNAKFYYVDSATGRIDAFDFDLANGTITNRSPFVQFTAAEGTPDGMTIDRDGFLWVALWDGGEVRRYSPRGRLDTVVALPVARPTCCALGGEELRDLYITTAMPDSHEERHRQPTSGSLFRAQVDVPGLPTNRCRYQAS